MILSSARVYIFGVKYKTKEWLSVLDCNELSGLLANLLKANIPELVPKNIQIIKLHIRLMRML